MRKLLLLLYTFFVFSSLLAENDPNQWLANQQVSFTENKGQIADKGKIRKDILFTAQGKGVKIYFTRKGIIYNYIQTEETFLKKPKTEAEKDKIRKEHPEQIQHKSKSYGMELIFVGAAQNMEVKSEEETGETSNYYLPHCPDGIISVKSYKKITYQNIYPNIDLVFYGNEQGMKYDFIVKPGGDINQIQLRYKDVQDLKLLKDGSLEIKNPLGKLIESKPFTYQNNKTEVKSNYKLKGRTLSFQVEAYDKTQNLIIDPSIVWATYYGGTWDELGYGVATDKNGNVYLVGETTSATGIASRGFQNTSGGYSDAFLVKFSSSGQRIWATYYGGESYSYGRTLSVDVFGDVYLAGRTYSQTGIASGGFQSNYGGGTSDAFLVKFNSSGQRLWATYYGGEDRDFSSALSTDASGNVYLAGYTASRSGIASGGFQNTFGGYDDAFLVKFSSSGQRIWATYYGGDRYDFSHALSTDASGNVYLAGDTSSETGIASGGFQNTISLTPFGGNAGNAFLVKFSSSGQRIWATYYGGENSNSGNALSTDASGNVYLAGYTASQTGIASGGFQNTISISSFAGNWDTFLVKFSSSGQRLWATYYGGEDNDLSSALSIDVSGNVYLAGRTHSQTGIASGGFQNNYRGGDYDIFLVKFSSSGQRLWATYYGGENNDYSNALSTDASGNVYLAGNTNSKTGISSGGFQNTYEGDYWNNAFLVKITDKDISNIITGIVFNDLNGNCKKETNENLISGMIIQAEPDGFFSVSDSVGKYSIQVGIGTYSIKQVLPSASSGRTITQICPVNNYKIEFVSMNSKVTEKDFGNQGDVCPYLETNVSSNRRRRCFLNNTIVNYSNIGFAKAENVKVYVQLPEYVVLKSADKTFTKDSEGNYVFNIGTLEANQSGTINIQDSVVCKSGITGLTACTKVWITPSNNCQTPSVNWDKSDIFVSGKCLDNGFLRMGVYNFGSGNMKDSSEYRVFINAELAFKKKFKLPQNDSIIFRIPANGRTVRLEADEPKEHPSKSATNVTIENCGTSPNAFPVKGYVTKLPQDDSEPEVAIQCLPIIDSFDPNDKQVMPEGTTSQHFTPTNAELQYLIRFQNTGTDTAYTVTVIDTLSENLDIATLQIGASSHKYKLNVSGKGKPVLTWTFNNINLPDSTRNEKASNGFLSFSIKPKENLPVKTKIENFADIIFDFNDPVRTNTTFNTIYDVPADVVESIKLEEKAIIPLPVISSFSPAKVKVGENVTVKGKNFETLLQNNLLKIKDLQTVIQSANDSVLVFKVPQGAVSGKLSLKTSYGLTESQTSLEVLNPPVITSFSPETGIPNDKITILGSGFDVIKTNNTVKFGEIPAEVISSSATSLEVKVPSGFYQAKISVSTPIGTSISSKDFTMLLTPLEKLPDNQIKIYPNPTDGKITLDFSKNAFKVQEIKVLNVMGSRIFEKKADKSLEKVEIDLSGKSAGIYLLVIQTESGLITQKIILK